MGRRKRRKEQVKRPVRRIPTIFICPHCSRQSLRITIKHKMGEDYAVAEATCGECGLCARFTVPSIMQPVDAYGKLIDIYDSYEGDVSELIEKGVCLGDIGGERGFEIEKTAEESGEL